MTEQHDRFSRAIETATRLDVDWRPLERRIRDCIPDLGAASYDSEPGDPVVWCDDDERPVTECHKLDLLCRGVPMARKVDPTGDNAVSNRAWDDAREWVKHARAVSHAVEQMVRIAERYKPDDPQLALELDKANEKPDGCQVCSRSGKWVPALVEASQAITGTVLRLCRWHHDFATDHGRLPDEAEEARHQSGKRVVVRVKQMDRLRRGLDTGRLSA